VTGLITHKLPLAEIQKGFAIAAEAKDSLKVIILPHYLIFASGKNYR
jgi:threonine dehydrogenase-like Zn-dependent dehydrogenase